MSLASCAVASLMLTQYSLEVILETETNMVLQNQADLLLLS